jgi:two-component system sensor histidine kinase PilS (NtrC family)
MAHREEMALRKEMDFVDARGERRRVGYAAFPLRGRGGAVIGHALIFQDLTAMRAMEDAVRRSERLADLGRLAAGLAHELRNPLASMSGSIELLMANEGLGEGDRRLMEIVLREAGRLEDLVRRFLQFTRPPEPRCVRTDVAEVVAETLAVFAHDPVGERLALDRALAPAVVACDGDQLRQVLWNLLTNAAQAIDSARELTGPAPAGPLARARGPSSTRPSAATLRTGLIRVSCGPEPDGGARLVVSDDGPGIAAPDLLRVFTPFFTTKRDGTGLGLATVHRIVEAHGGSVSVDSREGEGATFVVRLPAAPPAGGAAGPG